MGRFTTSGQILLAKNQSQPTAEDGAAKIRHEMLVLKQRKQVLKNISFFWTPVSIYFSNGERVSFTIT